MPLSIVLLAAGLWHAERNRGILTSAGVIADACASVHGIIASRVCTAAGGHENDRRTTCCPSWKINRNRMLARSRGSSIDSLDDALDSSDSDNDEDKDVDIAGVRGRMGVRHTSSVQFDEDIVQRGTDTSVASQFIKMNLAIVAIGMVLSGVAEKSGSGSPLGTGYAILSLLCCIIAVSLTHGLGGRLYNQNKGWNWFQPFRGGGTFVAMQIMGWVILGISVASQMFFIVGSAYLGLQAIVGFMYVGGALAFLSQVIIILSMIMHFKGDVRTEKDIDRIKLREERRFKVFGTRSFEDLTAWESIVERFIRVRDSIFMHIVVAIFFNLQ